MSWPGHLGSVTITYDAPLRKYVMFMSRPHDGVNTTAPYDVMVLESGALTGPYRMVHWLPNFGTQAYFVNAPSKFISADGRTMWMSYSGNYNNSSGSEDPPGSTYSWVLRKFTFDARGDAPRAAGGPAAAAACSDSAGPDTKLGLVRVKRSRIVVTGRASDRGCAGVARVLVSVARRERSAGRCRFLLANGRLGSARSCRRPVVQAARGTRAWAFTRPVRLPRGRYTVRARAFDAAGNAERAVKRANRRFARVG